MPDPLFIEEFQDACDAAVTAAGAAGGASRAGRAPPSPKADPCRSLPVTVVVFKTRRD